MHKYLGLQLFLAGEGGIYNFEERKWHYYKL